MGYEMIRKGIILGLVAVGIVGVYLALDSTYIIRKCSVNGVDISYMRVDDAVEKIENTIEKEYKLEIETIDRGIKTLSGEQLNLKVSVGDNRDKIRAIRGDGEIGLYVDYDKGIVDSVIDSLGGDIPSEDAYLSDSMEIIKEKQGNKIKANKVRDSLGMVIEGLGSNINLYKASCYEEPNLTASMIEDRIEDLEKENKYSINYKVCNKEYKYNWEYVKDYLKIGTSGEVVIEHDKAVDKFVKQLNKDLTTFGNGIDFKTSKGDTIYVNGGNWGWWLNREKMIESIKGLTDKAGEVEGKLYWRQEGAERNLENPKKEEIRNYVEIDLTNQHLYLYKNSSLVGDWGIVSGTYTDKNRRTPSGIYRLSYKERNATLNGVGYSTPVSYWMPFNGGIGIHDATWRNKFSGDIYKRNGSHGCINMPLEGARAVYNTIDSSYAIICYYR